MRGKHPQLWQQCWLHEYHWLFHLPMQHWLLWRWSDLWRYLSSLWIPYIFPILVAVILKRWKGHIIDGSQSLNRSHQLTDINECCMQTDHCHVNATCTNAIGSLACKCDAGLPGDGVPREGISVTFIEKVMGNPILQSLFAMIHEIGLTIVTEFQEWFKKYWSLRFRQSASHNYCLNGFKTIGCISIVDIDECTTNSHNCDENAACMNSMGSFTCQCNTGHSGDGMTCDGKIRFWFFIVDFHCLFN